ncbi:hypothetical protein GOSPT_140_00010, partial [Gordonia sputi NBRC 100414]
QPLLTPEGLAESLMVATLRVSPEFALSSARHVKKADGCRSQVRSVSKDSPITFGASSLSPTSCPGGKMDLSVPTGKKCYIS